MPHARARWRSCTGSPTCSTRTTTRPCAINALDNGTPVSAMRSGAYTARVDAVLRGLGRQARRRGGAGRGRRPRRRAPRALRRGRRDRAVERPDDGHGPEGGARAGGRQHRRRRSRRSSRRSVRCASPSSRSRRACRRACSTSCVGGAAAGDALVRHPGVDKVSFTGGCADGPAGDGGGGRDAHARSRSSSAASRPTSCSPTPTSTSRRRWRPCSAPSLLSGQGCALPDPPLRARRRLRRGRGDGSWRRSRR